MSTRIRSIRSQDDPKKPKNAALRAGELARARGEDRNACPFDISDSYGQYLAGHWLRGWDGEPREQ